MNRNDTLSNQITIDGKVFTSYKAARKNQKSREATQNKIIEMYDNGLVGREISEITKRSLRYVYAVLRPHIKTIKDSKYSKIIQAYDDGLRTYGEIVAKSGACKDVVKKILKQKYGAGLKIHRPYKIPPDSITKAAELNAEGYTRQEIARILGISDGAVYHFPIKFIRHRRKDLSEKAKEIYKKHMAGETVKALAYEYSYTPSNIHVILRNAKKNKP